MTQRKSRVLFLLKEYPQISQTYIKSEIEAVENDYDVTIATRRGPDIPYRNHRQFRRWQRPEELREIVEEVRPDILHTHYLVELPFIGELSRTTGIPFTVRTHSFDTLALRPKSFRGRVRQMLRRQPPLERTAWFREGLRAMEDDSCLSVLGFPFARPWLESVGAPSRKLIDCFPVVAVRRFSNRDPNGDDVMNTGVATPKKCMDDFLKLSAKTPERRLRLYGMGYEIDKLAAKNAKLGGRVEFIDPVEPDDMPAEYKKHQWLVYTADFDIPTVGWPMAIAEAQAAGVGVCMPRIRPDLAQYVGDGGFLYSSLDEVAHRIRGRVPDEIREAGFIQARKSDIEEHKHLLTDLWDKVRPAATKAEHGQRRSMAQSSG